MYIVFGSTLRLVQSHGNRRGLESGGFAGIGLITSGTNDWAERYAPGSRLCAVPAFVDVRAIEKDRMHNLSAVIVTYNNSEMLEAVLQDLGLQTMRLHKILLMDNSDSSVTRVMVYRKFPSVIHVKMPENVGTAGGFHEGIKRALGDCDFVLTLDDDVRLHPDSVANLYRGFIRLQRQAHRLGAVRAVGLRHEGVAPRRLDTFAWRGTLISVEAIRRVGLPLPDYFMYADDVEYSMRWSRRDMRYLISPTARLSNKEPRTNCPSGFSVKRWFVMPRGSDFTTHSGTRFTHIRPIGITGP